MSKRLIVIAAICLLLSGCGSFCTRAENPVQTPQDPVAECRALAPEDPYVENSESADAAYQACSEAAKSNPNDPEIIYLLATSALESEHMDEALTSFQKAEELGNCKALYYLGDNAWYVNKDAVSAEVYYKRGAECGDERASQEISLSEKFQTSEHPDLIAALYNTDIPKLNRFRFVTASYVYGFYKELGEQYLGENLIPVGKLRTFAAVRS